MADESKTAKAEAENIRSAEHTRSGCYFRPNVDILERPDELVVLADVPGASGENIDIDFEDGTLTIRARVEPRDQGRPEFLVREYSVGDFCRTFHVSEVIDAEKITAECADGVLTLHLPKAEAAKPRKIAVQIE
jgi:HSP20 family molecular chaperone IbpA